MVRGIGGGRTGARADSRSRFPIVLRIVILMFGLGAHARGQSDVDIYVVVGGPLALGAGEVEGVDSSAFEASDIDARIPLFWSCWTGEHRTWESSPGGVSLGPQRLEATGRAHWGPEVGLGRGLWELGERSYLIVKVASQDPGCMRWDPEAADRAGYERIRGSIRAALASLRPEERGVLRGVLLFAEASGDEEADQWISPMESRLADALDEEFGLGNRLRRIAGTTPRRSAVDRRFARLVRQARGIWVWPKILSEAGLRGFLDGDGRLNPEGRIEVGRRAARMFLGWDARSDEVLSFDPPQIGIGGGPGGRFGGRFRGAPRPLPSTLAWQGFESLDSESDTVSDVDVPSLAWRVTEGHAEVAEHDALEGDASLRIEGGWPTTLVLETGEMDTPWSLSFAYRLRDESEGSTLVVETEVDGAWRFPYEVTESEGGKVRYPFLVFPPGFPARIRIRADLPWGADLTLDALGVNPRPPRSIPASLRASAEGPWLLGSSPRPLGRLDTDGVGEGVYPRLQRIDVDLVGPSASEAVHELILRQQDESGRWIDLRSELVSGSRVSFVSESGFPFRQGPIRIDGRSSEAARVGEKLGVRLSSIGFEDGSTGIPPAGDPGPPLRRIGRDLGWPSGPRSIDPETPTLVRSGSSGTLVAAYVVFTGDAQGSGPDSDPGSSIEVRRSHDGGTTWDPATAVVNSRSLGVGHRLSEPTLVAHPSSESIWMLATWTWPEDYVSRTARGGSGLVLLESRDGGRRWTSPREVSSSINREGWRSIHASGGRGVWTRGDELVMPIWFQNALGMTRAALIVSADHGATWSLGRGAMANTTFSSVVETEDGTLVVGMHDLRSKGRSFSRTVDLGATWSEAFDVYPGLEDSGARTALLLGTSGEPGGSRPWCLGAPEPGGLGEGLEIRSSTDGGASWSSSGALRLHRGGGTRSVSMEWIEPGVLGVLYSADEGSGLIVERLRIGN